MPLPRGEGVGAKAGAALSSFFSMFIDSLRADDSQDCACVVGSAYGAKRAGEGVRVSCAPEEMAR